MLEHNRFSHWHGFRSSPLRTILTLLAVLAILSLIACSTAERDAARRMEYVDSHPDIPELMANSIIDKRIMVGMSEEMVEVTWGKPTRVSESKSGEQPLNEWVYGNVFTGGPVTKLYFNEEHALVRYEVQDLSTNQDASGVGSRSPSEVSTSTDGSLSRKQP